MKLFEITIEAAKSFYVEAENQDGALEHDAVENEGSISGGDVDWEKFDTTAKEISSDQARFIRVNHPKQIRKI